MGSGPLSRALSVFAGSPFTVKISGEGRVKESITRTSRAPSVATVGSICDLNLKIPGEPEGLVGPGNGRHWKPSPGLAQMVPSVSALWDYFLKVKVKSLSRV